MCTAQGMPRPPAVDMVWSMIFCVGFGYIRVVYKASFFASCPWLTIDFEVHVVANVSRTLQQQEVSWRPCFARAGLRASLQRRKSTQITFPKEQANDLRPDMIKQIRLRDKRQAERDQQTNDQANINSERSPELVRTETTSQTQIMTIA